MADNSCPKCDGSGKVPCQGCGGTGGVKDYSRKEEARWSSCSGCHGTGERTCTACGGTGKKSGS